MRIKQRHFIKSSEIKILKDEILKQYDQKFSESLFPKKARVELILTDLGDSLYAINKVLALWKSNDGYLPVLTLLLNKRVEMKKIVVDKGAIKFITNGASVMIQGVTQIDPSIKKGNIVVIVDENHDRALAIGKAMFDAKEMENKNSGKVVKNLHTIQDNVWKFEKQFK